MEVKAGSCRNDAGFNGGKKQKQTEASSHTFPLQRLNWRLKFQVNEGKGRGEELFALCYQVFGGVLLAD